MSKRAIALIICLLLTVPATVFGSIAYLNDTEEVVNTMTVGKVNIVVDEGKVNKEGYILGEDGNPVTNSEGEKIKVGADGFVVDENGNPVKTEDGNNVVVDEDGYLVTDTPNEGEIPVIVDADGNFVLNEEGNPAVNIGGTGFYIGMLGDSEFDGTIVDQDGTQISENVFVTYDENSDSLKLVDRNGNELGVDENGNIVNEDGDVVVSAEALAGKTVLPTQGRDEEGNEYRLVPGKTYQKDPTVKVSFTSEDSYVRMLVTFSEYSELKTALGGSFDYEDLGIALNEGWALHGTAVEDTENNTVTYEFRYDEIVSGGEEVPAVFSSITVPGALTGDDLATIDGMTIKAAGHAMQADGFKDAEAAWNEFDGKTGNAG